MAIETLTITGLALRLAGYQVQFRVERDEDGATLYIKTPERDVSINVSHGQYFALEAAINDVADADERVAGQYLGVMASGEWFGNDS